jgi:predicted hydrocarbon binding protein
MENRTKASHPDGRRGSKALVQKTRPKYLDGLVFNPEMGVLSAPNGDDVILMNMVSLKQVFTSVREMLHVGSDLIWYNAGVQAGSAEGRRLKRLVAKIGQEGFLQLIADLYTNLGWGVSTIADFDSKGRSVTVYTRNNPLVRGVTASHPVCHYIKGFYKGFGTVVFLSSRVEVDEPECEATGAERCKFTIRW